MTLLPIISVVLSSLILIRLLVVLLVYKTLLTEPLAWILLVLVLLPVITAFRRYLEVIHFIHIATPWTLSDNMQQVQKFLESQQLLTLRHPQAPEVFQIVSTPIGGNEEEREVMVFIVGEREVLINSHFTSSRKGFKFMIRPTHRKEMTKRFIHWMNQTTVGNAVVRS